MKEKATSKKAAVAQARAGEPARQRVVAVPGQGNDPRAALAIWGGGILLPLREGERSGADRPGFNWQVGGNRIQAERGFSAVEVGFVRIIHELQRNDGLPVWHEHIIHFRKQPQGTPGRR